MAGAPLEVAVSSIQGIFANTLHPEDYVSMFAYGSTVQCMCEDVQASRLPLRAMTVVAGLIDVEVLEQVHTVLK
jgi:hypothetical protein